ncbi:MAG: alanine racemase, partial [Acidimicrobiales bacterium]
MTSDAPVLSKPRATVHLDALAANYRTILAELSGVPAAGVVKADGYGLGAVPVAKTLWAQGCRRFFVARLDEAITVRAAIPRAEINVFDGVLPGTAKD